jgi:hypothetical protein
VPLLCDTCIIAYHTLFHLYSSTYAPVDVTCPFPVCAGVKRLAALGMVSGHPGMAALDMGTAEDAIVNGTREVVPGMVMTGMELAEVGRV